METDRKAYYAAYYAKNKAAIDARAHEYCTKHRALMNARAAKYYARNKEAKNAYQAEYRAKIKLAQPPTLSRRISVDISKIPQLTVVYLRTNLTQPELALLLRVSLVTAHKYLHGAIVSEANKLRVAQTTATLRDLVQSGKFPIPYRHEADKDVREAALQKLRGLIDHQMELRQRNLS